MSAIAGIVWLDGRPAEAATLDAMRRATPFLGADGVDAWRDGPAGLLRFALRSTPQSLTETQPCGVEGSDARIVMDGRLDNRDEILGRLGAGAPAKAAPDAQIALAALERLGEGALDAFAGDFALAVWRPGRRQLFCARSNGGWRPLLWTFDGRRLAFATEPRTLVEGLGLPRRLNEGFAAEFLAIRVTSPSDTLWKDVQRLPPGFSLTLENGQVRTRRWYDGPFEDLTGVSEAEHVERFRALLDQSLIAAHRSATPVAAQLSGGLDSSTVVCRGLELYRAGRIDAPLRAVSTRYYGDACDEGAWIEAVERQAGVSSIQVAAAPGAAGEPADWCRTTYQLPLRPSVHCTETPISRLPALGGAKVILTGEGGDDWLGGTHSHWPDLFVRGRWGRLFDETFGARPDRSAAANLRTIVSEAVLPLLVPIRRQRVQRPNLNFSTAVPPWVRSGWADDVGLVARWRAMPDLPRLGGLAQQQRYWSSTYPRKHINLDNTLTYVASQGMELRHPLHDQRLVKFFMGCDGGLLRRGLERKHLLRVAMRGTLPEQVRTRQTKANMSSSILTLARRRLAERPIEALAPVRLGWLDAQALRTIEATVGGWIADGAVGPAPGNYAAVWNAISIDLWLEHAFGL
ncbi:MAG TPA: asparagine synthase-related protein [Caulobacteraceae bacterium]|jgi:asparagine synthase (glutamine-hydrolysing)